MIKDVLKMGNPKLLEISLAVAPHEFGTAMLDGLITDMLDTKRHYGGVGIAAIQIGVAKRVLLIEFDGNNPRYKEIGDCPLQVIINPEFEVIGSEVVERDEGCLSVPGLRGPVVRPKCIRYKYWDQNAKLVVGESDSFFARVLQHESDHLNGVLFPMRITDMTRFGFIDAMRI